MAKTNFIKKLESILENMEFTGEQVKEITDDYIMMIDEALDRGEDESDFIAKLGTPKEIARALKKELPPVDKPSHKIIALSPFVALIVFFLFGFTLDAWHPGWLVFLIIPVSAITLEVKGYERGVALSPFVALTAFMLLGTYLELWHPFWALFICVAGLGFFTHRSKIVKCFGLYTFAAVTLFIILILTIDLPGYWHYLILLPIVFMGLLTGVIQIGLDDDDTLSLKRLIWGSVFLLALIAIYIVIGLQFARWHPTWLIFLTVPLAALAYRRFIRKEQVPWVAFMPFIATIVFILWGEYGNAYMYSWLVFLSIPMVAILSGSKKH